MLAKKCKCFVRLCVCAFVRKKENKTIPHLHRDGVVLGALCTHTQRLAGKPQPYSSDCHMAPTMTRSKMTKRNTQN